VFMWRLLTAE